MRISSADGAEEFVWLLGQCLVHYGSLIAHGMYQHIQVANQPEACESCHVHNWGDGEGNQKSQKSQHNQQNQPKSVAEADEQVLQTNPPSQPIRRATPSAKSSRKEDEHEVHLRETIDGMRVDLDETGTVLEFGHIAGLDEVKLALEQFACFFLHFPHLTRNLRQRSTTGILLFGPQGTGKTLLVRSFAQRYGLALYDVRASAIMSKFVGESEKFIRTLFSEVRAHAPAVLLLDECDGLLCDPTADAMQSHNYRLLQNEIKNQWSDLMHSRDEVIVIGATNKPHDIDMDGFGRRLSLKLHVDLPTAEGCMLILEKALGRLRHQVDKDDFPVLGFLCHEKGLSGYDIDVLVESLLRRALRDITVAQHFVAIPWEESEIIVPCADNHIGAMSGPWTRFEPEAVSYSPFGFSQVETAISRAKATVDHTMRQKHAGFAEQYSAE